VGGLLKVTDYTSGTTHHFVAYDGNGNVAALVDGSTGATAARYEYGPFGEPLRATGSMGKKNPLRFSTKYTDNESGLLYYGYRYYNPSTGRWPSRDGLHDPAFKLLIEGSSQLTRKKENNLYTFVDGNAPNSFDPLGLRPQVQGEPKWDNCSETLKRWIRRELAKVCDKSKKDRCGGCLDKLPEKYALNRGTYRSEINSICRNPEKVAIRCQATNDGVCSSGGPGIIRCGYADLVSETITLCPADFEFGSGCYLFCNLAHELGHIIGGPGDVANDFAKCFRCRGGLPH
jgi:RHS repeat-associated protein